mgnify:FL=1
MPIREIRANDLDQECAKCGRVVAVPVTAIVAGISREGQVNSNVVAMPGCTGCGSVEFLLRSPTGEDHPSQGSYGHRHKLLVDTLHAKLVKGGRLAQGLTPETAPIKEPPTAVMDRWFTDGLKLPPPPKTDGGAQ